MRKILIFLLLIMPMRALTQERESIYPAMIALSKVTGFVHDSAEIAAYKLFPELELNDLSYLVIIENSEKFYNVQAVYKTGSVLEFNLSYEKIAAKWNMIPDTSGRVADMEKNKARIQYPGIVTWKIRDQVYETENFWINRKTFFYAQTGIGIPVVYNKTLLAFYINLNSQFGNNIITAELITGGEVELFGNPSVSNFISFGTYYGYNLTSKSAIVSPFAGVQLVEIKRTTISGLWGFSPVETRSVNDSKFAFPIGMNISLPSCSGVGFNMKFQWSFISGIDDSFFVGAGIRIGRAGNRMVNR